MIFLSAFLLFQMQPLIAKIILRGRRQRGGVDDLHALFPGAAARGLRVFARLRPLRIPAPGAISISRCSLSPRRRCRSPRAPLEPAGGEDPTWGGYSAPRDEASAALFRALHHGPPGAGLVRRALREGAAPYRLFALSNLGSMLALVSYPLAVEPLLALGTQAAVWSAGSYCRARVRGARLAQPRRRGTSPCGRRVGQARTGTAGALGVARMLRFHCWLLAFTGHMTLNIAAIPFLWVLASRALSPLLRALLRGFGLVQALAVSAARRRGVRGSLRDAHPLQPEHLGLIPLYSATLFAACMVCHGELARSKPHPQQLTGFYLMLALGGAAGGLLARAGSRPTCSRTSTSCRSACSRSRCS